MLSGFVRQNSGKLQVAPLDDNQKLVFVERLNGRGTWELQAGYGTETAEAFLTTTGPGIIAYAGGATVLSGHATAMRRQDSDVVTIIGIDDTGLLGDRIIEPDPAGLSLDLQQFDTRTGPVSTVLQEFIEYNMGPSAHPDRRISDFSLATDPVLGGTITVNGRFQQLDEIVFDKAGAYGLAYRALQNSANAIVGEFTAQALVDGEVFATEGYNTVTFDSSAKAATATYVVTAGEGEGVARLVVRAQQPMTGRFAGRRIEQFLDQRQEDDTQVLTDKAGELLAETEEAISLKVNLAGDDAFTYKVGDIAPVQIEGVRFELPVYETRTEVTPGAITRELSIGDRDGADQTAGLARLANRSNRKIRNIERF